MPRMKAGQLLRLLAATLILIVLLIINVTHVGLMFYPARLFNTALALAAGAALLGWRALRRRAFPHTPLDLGFLAWGAGMALAVLFSTQPRLSLERLAWQIVFILLFYALVDLMRAGWKPEMWTRTLLLVATFPLLFGFWQIFSWWQSWLMIGGWSDPIPPATFRVTSLYGHANIAAALLWMYAATGMAATLRAGRWLTRAICASWTLGGLILIFFTSSRGGWLGSAAGTGVFALLVVLDRRDRALALWNRLRARPWVLAGLALALLLALSAGAALVSRQIQHPTHPDGGSVSGARNYIWSVALDLFRAHPVTGGGQGTFGLLYQRTYSIPPGMLLAHAHNLFLNMLAETGLLGALGLISLVACAGWAAVRRWRQAPAGSRLSLAGLIAALTGLAVHSLFDTPTTVPAASALAALLLALLAAPLEPVASKPSRFARFPALIPVGLLVLYAAINAFSLRAQGFFNAGLDAAVRSDWQPAVREIDRALALDPGMVFYRFQAGMAHAQLALAPDGSVRDPLELDAALEAYRTGLAQESSYCLNWAVYARLEWLAGAREFALADMARAVQLAPQSPVLQAYYGEMLEQAGQPEVALQAYAAALQQQPVWAAAPFFKATALRRQAASQAPALQGGWAQLAAGDFTAAEQTFRAEVGLNTAAAYRGLGQALTGLGRYEEAERALLTSRFIEPASPDIHRALAALYARTGNRQGESEALAAAQDLFNRAGAFGPGRLGDSGYAFYIFHRESLAPDLAPGMGWLGGREP